IGKSLEMQLGFGEYLRAYMDNGPWFDEQGNHSNAPSCNQSLVEANRKTGEAVSLYWGRIRSEYQANGGRNYLSYTHFVLLLGSILFLPFDALQNLTYRVAKRY